jgi:excisionase family DNA binding protein
MENRPRKMDLQEHDFYTVPELAKVMRVAEMTAYRWAAAREGRSVRFGPTGRTIRIPAQVMKKVMAGEDV